MTSAASSSLNAQLTRLRDLLHRAEPAETWPHLCRVFLDWGTPETLTPALDYTCDHITRDPERWSDVVTWVPGPWEGGRWHDPPDPRVRLLYALELDRAPGVWIPPGTFLMGEPSAPRAWCEDEHAHEVTLTRGFVAQTTPVTRAQWEALMGEHASSSNDHPELPVDTLSWFDAVRYCNALSERDGFAPAYTVSRRQGVAGTSSFRARVRRARPDTGGWRLPTEAEWEYAARAMGSPQTYGPRSASAWFAENSNLRLQPVGLKQPNPWGLYDALGNVWEWCWDPYGPYPTRPATDPVNRSNLRTGDPAHILRGGSFRLQTRNLRLSNRWRLPPSWSQEGVGVRPVRTLDLDAAPDTQA